MAVTKISLTGRNKGDGTLSSWDNNNELFLKVFSGEVLQTFETATVMKPLHTVRTISSGKSAQFPVTGIASASYYKPGEDIMTDGSYVTPIKHSEKIITIDDLLLATTFIDRLDEAKNHYDVRSIYSTELGRALARTMDKNLIGVGLNTAAKTWGDGTVLPVAQDANIAGESGAGLVLNDNALGAAGTSDIPSSGAAKFVELMYQAAAEMDEKNVPSEERYIVLTPVSYYNILNSDAGRIILNRDFGASRGSYQEAEFPVIAGFNIIKSNIAPQVYGQDVSAVGSANGATPFAPGHRNLYSGNFETVKGLFFQKQAFGTVKLMDLAMESEYDIRLQGHLMVAKYAMGHGALRPECAGILCGAVG
jgi:hypothetical protein